MLRVLIVDDDAVYRMMHVHVIELAGHDVTEAESLAEASVALAESTFDLVVCDYRLDDGIGLDLLDVTSSLRSRPCFVLVTGEADADQLGDYRASRVDGYLTKPAASETILDCVRRCEAVHEQAITNH